MIRELNQSFAYKFIDRASSEKQRGKVLSIKCLNSSN